MILGEPGKSPLLEWKTRFLGRLGYSETFVSGLFDTTRIDLFVDVISNLLYFLPLYGAAIFL